MWLRLWCVSIFLPLCQCMCTDSLLWDRHCSGSGDTEQVKQSRFSLQELQAFQSSEFRGIWGPVHWKEMAKEQTDQHMNTPKSLHEESFRQSPVEGHSTKYLTGAPVKVIKNQEKSGKLSQARGTQRTGGL